jgi:hypothetical protein
MTTYALNIRKSDNGYYIEDLNDDGQYIEDSDGNNTFETLDEAIDVRDWFLLTHGTDEDNGMGKQ